MKSHTNKDDAHLRTSSMVTTSTTSSAETPVISNLANRQHSVQSRGRSHLERFLETPSPTSTTPIPGTRRSSAVSIATTSSAETPVISNVGRRTNSIQGSIIGERQQSLGLNSLSPTTSIIRPSRLPPSTPATSLQPYLQTVNDEDSSDDESSDTSTTESTVTDDAPEEEEEAHHSQVGVVRNEDTDDDTFVDEPVDEPVDEHVLAIPEAIPEEEAERQGQLCFGCCLDFRRAVILVNIVTILLKVALIALTATGVYDEFVSGVTRAQDRTTVIQDPNNGLPGDFPGVTSSFSREVETDPLQHYETAELILAGVSIAWCLVAIAGARLYSDVLVGFNAVWLLVSFILGIVLVKVHCWSFCDGTKSLNDEPCPCRLNIPLMIATGVATCLFIYTHIGFVVQVRKGIMSKETYSREAFSCCGV